MKKLITICIAILMIASVFPTQQASAQSPEKMSYQAVVRDASNDLVINQPIGMQLSILQGSASGSVVYVETQSPNTNSNGLVSIEIGSGTVILGSFNTIDWGAGPYFIKTETDPTGGTAYTITGVSQLLSVPYALHAKTAESFTGTITETDPIFGTSVASDITAADTTHWNDHFSGDYNDLINQPTIPPVPASVSAFSNDIGYVTTSNDADADPNNEIQTINRTGTTVTLSNGGGSFEDSVGVYIAGAGIDITNNVVSTTSPCGLSIGDTYQGGIIFYLDPSGCHGLICAPSNQSSSATWNGFGPTNETRAYGSGLSEGYFNTLMMNQIQSEPTAPATICSNLSLGGYDDWYLPSAGELKKMQQNIGPNSTLGLGNIGSLSGRYWSSTEFDKDNAIVVHFGLGDIYIESKYSPQQIRAVRSF